MEQLTKEQVCDKIKNLSNELVTYRDLLNKIDRQEKSEFEAKVKSMVGGYYVHNLSEADWYCHIVSASDIEDDGIDAYVKCDCAFISIPKAPYGDCRLSLEPIYVDKGNIEYYKPITKEEFDAAAAKVIKKFNNKA